jgi:cytochrome c5
VSASQDRKFFDTFMLVLGILIGVAIALIFVARLIASNTSVPAHREDPLAQQQVADRIAPVAQVAVAGQDNSALAAAAPAPAPPAGAAAPAAAAGTDLPGEQAFGQVCTACHTLGVAGAPKVGDKAAWAPRIAQGADTLHKHALEGFQGKAGYMPPKGGRADLSDQSIMNAVDYMVSQSK